MENKSLDNQMRVTGASVLKLVGLIFLSVGLIFLLAGAFIYDRKEAQTEGFEKTVGVIAGFHNSGYPYVTFEAGGETHTALLPFSSTVMKVGDELDLLYDPMAPEHVMNAGLAGMFLPLLFMSLGTVFALLGGVLLLLRRRIRENSSDPWGG